MAAAAADAAQAASAADDAIMGASDPYVALLQRAMLARLQSMGFARAEAREALEAAGWIEEDATYALLRSLQPAGIVPGTSMSVEEAAAERGEEALALSAILEGAFRDLTGDFAAPGDESVVPCVVCGAAAGNTNVSCSRCRAEKHSDVGQGAGVPSSPCLLIVHL